MIAPANRRVAQIVGATNFNDRGGGRRYHTANPGGPAGSATMTYFAIFTLRRLPSAVQPIFGRSTMTVAGWNAYVTNSGGGLAAARAYDSAPAQVTATISLTAVDLHKPLVLLATYVGGTMRLWLNAVAGTPAVSGSGGFTAQSQETTIGARSGGALYADGAIIHECGMLDAYDATASAVSLSRQWQEDLQQNRYLTWPRTMTVNDWYWSAQDAVCGTLTRSTWTDRGPNAVPMTKMGDSQGAAVPARFSQ